MSKTLSVSTKSDIGMRIEQAELPSFSSTGSIKGMKKQYYGKDALLVKVGDYIYNCTSTPDLYKEAEKLSKNISR